MALALAFAAAIEERTVPKEAPTAAHPALIGEQRKIPISMCLKRMVLDTIRCLARNIPIRVVYKIDKGRGVCC